MSLKLDCLKWFTQSKSDPEKWECKCGKTFRRKLNTGWTNLHKHIVKQHSEENKNDLLDAKEELSLTLTNRHFGYPTFSIPETRVPDLQLPEPDIFQCNNYSMVKNYTG